jgi:methionyl-tRNA formyltransferase
VVAVVSQPDRGRGRGRRLAPSPVAERALARGLPLLRPERASDPDFAQALARFAPDLGIVVAFGQFLPRRIRELPRLGYLINAHASLLPRHRGAAPIAHAILAGDTTTGVCAMRVEREMDAGAVCGVRETPIGPEETAGELSERLAALAAELIAETVERAARGELAWREQDAARATLAPRIEREDARLDFREPAVALARRVRAMAPRPGAFTTWDGAPLRILAARALDAGSGPSPRLAPPGTVRLAPGGAPCIATGQGWLVPLRLQRAGGRELDAAEFQRGRGLADGVRLGEPAPREPGSAARLG